MTQSGHLGIGAVLVQLSRIRLRSLYWDSLISPRARPSMSISNLLLRGERLAQFPSSFLRNNSATLISQKHGMQTACTAIALGDTKAAVLPGHI
jgi:hypothetical protein